MLPHGAKTEGRAGTGRGLAEIWPRRSTCAPSLPGSIAMRAGVSRVLRRSESRLPR